MSEFARAIVKCQAPGDGAGPIAQDVACVMKLSSIL